jgi:hypothetical protein
MPIQEEHTPVPDDMQERPVPVGASKGVAETVKKGGPVVPEDESQSKSVNPAVKEWSPAEKRSWEALVNEVIKGFEIYMLPIGDVSELRKFTVEEPEPEYDYLFWLLGDILEVCYHQLEINNYLYHNSLQQRRWNISMLQYLVDFYGWTYKVHTQSWQHWHPYLDMARLHQSLLMRKVLNYYPFDLTQCI